MILKPFFSYFGSKYRLSKKYHEPTKNVLIEPFAGSACYSLHYPHKQVKLFDKYGVICSIWDYLIHVSENEFLNLPLIDFDKPVDDYNICQEAKYLIGFWLMSTSTSPGLKHTSRSIKLIQGGHLTTRTVNNQKITTTEKPTNFSSWTEKNKIKIASQLQYIRHWTIENKSYDQIDNQNATWFIDPPYQIAGKSYKESSKNINFNHLGEWAKQRYGEIIVCENEGAKWLPFKSFTDLTNSRRKQTQEVVYYQGFENMHLNLLGE